jgi:hypothetical protein
MAKRKISVLSWDHAVPHLSTKALPLPYEGLVECDSFTRDDLPREQQEQIRRNIDKWLSNLPAELERITKAASEALARAAGKFECAEAKRVLWLVNKLRAVKGRQRQRDILSGYLLGRRVERLGVLPLESLLVSGRKAKIERPKKMREAKAIADMNRKCKNRHKAEQAIRVARGKFPSASFDNDTDTLEAEAAKILGKSRRTLNRWLGGK